AIQDRRRRLTSSVFSLPKLKQNLHIPPNPRPHHHLPSLTPFHASRKPPSIVKSVLGPSVNEQSNSPIDNRWAPFKGTEGTQRLGELDLAFLSSYALSMYFAGHLGDMIDLRLFLVFGMMGSGILNVHLLGFYMTIQIVCGLFQSIGWPCVVYVVANWCGKEKRGLIMGVWNSHTSVGKIVGSIVASSVLDSGWGWSFALPGGLVIVSGLVVRIISDLNLATII
ncbi:unnamed protein product, partial [Brassica napus]